MAEITWIKLKTDMFENDKIKLIEALPDADTIIVIWVKLLAAAGKANSNGFIMLTENIPMNVEEMATIFNRPLNTVRLALSTFQRYGMIEVENEAFRVKNWEIHQNIDGMERVKKLNAERNKRYRERKKQKELPKPAETPQVNNSSDVSVTSRDGTETDLDLDLDLELDKDKQHTDVGQVGSVDRFEELFNFYQNNFGVLTAYGQEEFEYIIKDYDADLILQAFKETALNRRVRKPLTYAEGILKNWKKEGITTLAQLEASRKEDENGRISKNDGKAKSQKPNIFGNYCSD